MRPAWDVVKPVHYGNKQVGEIINFRGQICYKTNRWYKDDKIHYFIKYQGWGINRAILDFAKENNAVFVIIDYRGKRGRVWHISSLQKWFTKGKPFETVKEYEEVIEDFGDQIILAKEHMNEKRW